MATEYEAVRDETLPIPAWPRPTDTQDRRIRALNLSGDSSGVLPADNHTFWNGGNVYSNQAYEAILEAQLAAEDAAVERYANP